MSRSRSGAAGFTLIELMVTVAIVAILTAVALTFYRSVQLKSHRAAAEAFLSTVAQAEQQYFIDNRAYAIDATGVPAITNSAGLNLVIPTTVSSYYTLSVTASLTGANAPASFIATATPLSGTIQTKDVYNGAQVVLTLDYTGLKAPSGVW